MAKEASVWVASIDALPLVEKPHALYRVVYDGADTFRMVLLQTLHAQMSSPPHVHDDAAELYVVLKGELHVVTSSESIRVPQGWVALVPAGVPHGVRNEHPEEEAVVLVLLGVLFHKDGVRPYPLPSNTL